MQLLNPSVVDRPGDCSHLIKVISTFSLVSHGFDHLVGDGGASFSSRGLLRSSSFPLRKA